MSKTPVIALASVAIVAAGIGSYFMFSGPVADPFEVCRTELAAGNAQIGGPFNLTDHNGNRVTETDVIDGLTLMYFGYTFCPDICPFDTVRNAEAVEILEEDNGIIVKPVFVSIDPARDTVEAMADFVHYIHPRMVGLVGSAEETAAASRAYKTYYKVEDHAEDDEFYLVSHSTSAYLMHPDHGLLQFFRRETTPEDMAQTIACYAGKL